MTASFQTTLRDALSAATKAVVNGWDIEECRVDEKDKNIVTMLTLDERNHYLFDETQAITIDSAGVASGVLDIKGESHVLIFTKASPLKVSDIEVRHAG